MLLGTVLRIQRNCLILWHKIFEGQKMLLPENHLRHHKHLMFRAMIKKDKPQYMIHLARMIRTTVFPVMMSSLISNLNFLLYLLAKMKKSTLLLFRVWLLTLHRVMPVLRDPALKPSNVTTTSTSTQYRIIRAVWLEQLLQISGNYQREIKISDNQ